jgi:hypothetical protein
MLLGVSAAVYAVTLAGVAGLQADSDAALVAARAPGLAALDTAKAANDALEARILAADSAARDLVHAYDGTAADAADYQARLDDLAALVAKVQGSAAALPNRIPLPAVAIHGPIGGTRSSRAPATSGRTGASGRP